MAGDIPRQALSEHFQERLAGRRVLGVLCLTYQYDPGFFEQEVLPALLDVAVSHAAVARALQLEGAVRELQHGVAVFCDWRGLCISDYGSPRLDVERVPVRLGTGIFHPKNVLILTEARDPSAEGTFKQELFVACASANLTRSGWWENVEVAHIESIEEGESTRLRDDLLSLFDRVERLAQSPRAGALLKPYRAFARKLEQQPRKSEAGRLRTHFYVGGAGGDSEDIPTFLAGMIPRDDGYCLEVISPYFDEHPAKSPLFSLIKRLKPAKTRVFLPKAPDGTAQCSKEMFDSVREAGAEWGALPDDLLSLGKRSASGERSVHAKVYRIFKGQPKREYLFVGSANLTAPAHSGAGGNLETGFLIEIEPPRRPKFWLKAMGRKPQLFEHQCPEDSDDDAVDVPLQLRFSWKDNRAFGRWDGQGPCPGVEICGQAGPLAAGVTLPDKPWTELDGRVAAALREELTSVSIVRVVLADGRESRILVQEEDLQMKPDLIHRLPVRDILEYWALLKAEQRQAFLDRKLPVLIADGKGALSALPTNRGSSRDDMFSRCAGIFHAFATLESRIVEAIEKGHRAQAGALIFGMRFDSLLTLLERIREREPDPAEAGTLDLVDRYLVAMCATQLRNVVSAKHEEFWSEYPTQAAELDARLAAKADLRSQLIASAPDGMEAFMGWFDHWFLKRQEPEVVAS